MLSKPFVKKIAFFIKNLKNFNSVLSIGVRMIVHRILEPKRLVLKGLTAWSQGGRPLLHDVGTGT